MDLLTQISIGAAAAALFSRPGETRRAILVGGLAGAAPDLDVFIQSGKDPLLSLQYHRHLTHALIVAPLIGLIVAGVVRLMFYSRAWPFGRLVLFSVAGALTHGPIDACTSYGTLLYWPFSHHRESWDIISIIDPIFTVPLVMLVILALVFRSPIYARVAVGLCLLYLGFGLYQRNQAENFALTLAEERGHQAENLTARPSLGNTILWRTVYRDGSQYYVDAVHLFPGQPHRHYPGASVDALTDDMAGGMVPMDSVTARDIGRFRHFSQGYLYIHHSDPIVIGDLRYAMFPDSIQPLWGIEIDPLRADQHTPLRHFREPSATAFERLWQMIRGLDVAGHQESIP